MCGGLLEAGRDGGLLKGEGAKEEVRRAMGFAAACGALVCQVAAHGHSNRIEHMKCRRVNGIICMYEYNLYILYIYDSSYVCMYEYLCVCDCVTQGAGAIDPQPSEGDVLSFLTHQGLTPPQWAAK